jgi:L-ascorbate metabolism protein UlaG (beta-lactamase superfamily)
MNNLGLIGLGVALLAAAAAFGAAALEKDLIPTSRGSLEITPITHGTLMFVWNGIVIHVDPVSRGGPDYAKMPKADLILITHEHSDHLDPAAVALLKKPGTEILYTAKCAEKMPGGTVLANGQQRTVRSISVEAVPAYNILHMRSAGVPYHPRGIGNGYVLTFGDKRVYVAGDTENIPEMKELNKIEVAFLPMNLPYTMTPEMVAEAARLFRPKILYPYHYGDTDPQLLVELLNQDKDIEVRIRNLR